MSPTGAASRLSGVVLSVPVTGRMGDRRGMLRRVPLVVAAVSLRRASSLQGLSTGWQVAS
jgi:hypothetical protein